MFEERVVQGQTVRARHDYGTIGAGSGGSSWRSLEGLALMRQQKIERRLDRPEHLGGEVVGQVIVDDVLLPPAGHC